MLEGEPPRSADEWEPALMQQYEEGVRRTAADQLKSAGWVFAEAFADLFLHCWRATYNVDTASREVTPIPGGVRVIEWARAPQYLEATIDVTYWPPEDKQLRENFRRRMDGLLDEWLSRWGQSVDRTMPRDADGDSDAVGP
jgi:hypothetical protein